MLLRSNYWRCSVGAVCLFFDKVAGPPAQVFFCEFCKSFKNAFFFRALPDDTLWKLKTTQLTFIHSLWSFHKSCLSNLRHKFRLDKISSHTWMVLFYSHFHCHRNTSAGLELQNTKTNEKGAVHNLFSTGAKFSKKLIFARRQVYQGGKW